jgi:hypothetical protein
VRNRGETAPKTPPPPPPPSRPQVRVARTGRTVALSRPQQMFAQDRSTVQEGFAGDVIGGLPRAAALLGCGWRRLLLVCPLLLPDY